MIGLFFCYNRYLMMDIYVIVGFIKRKLNVFFYVWWLVLEYNICDLIILKKVFYGKCVY